MSGLWRDLRFGVRALLARPAFTALAVVTLALGIATSTAVFSLVNGTILAALPWDHVEELVFIQERSSSDRTLRGVAPANYRDWSRQARSFRSVAAIREWRTNLTGGDRSQLVDGMQITPNALEVAGVTPALGRGFRAEEAVPGANRVAILTHGLWQTRYAGDPSVVGRKIEVDGEPATVVGVLAEYRWFPFPYVDILAPLRLGGGEPSRGDHSLLVIGRLAAGTGVEEARAEMRLISARLAEDYAESNEGWTADVQLAAEQGVTGPTRTAIWLMLGATLLVLFMACTNVASLVLVRAAGRRRELAVRAAMGARPAQLVQQLLAESVLLATAAGALSLLFARWLLDAMRAASPSYADYVHLYLRFDAPVWSYAALVSVASVALFGLLPALAASRADLHHALKEGGERGSTVGGGRLRAAGVAGQLALGVCLLAAAGLLIERYRSLQEMDWGFEPEGLLAASFQLPPARYPEASHRIGFERELRGRLQALPGVSAVATASWTPFATGAGAASFRVRGADSDSPAQAMWSAAGEGYFRTLGQPLLRGRVFGPGDGEDGAPVAVVNETLARRYLAGRDPIGAELLLESEAAPRLVVGVVGDAYQWSVTDAPQPHIYGPLHQHAGTSFHVLLRADREAGAIAPRLRATLANMDRLLPLGDIQTLAQRLDDRMWGQRFFATVIGSLAALAFIMAASGLYGTVSYQTARRVGEFGIRTALGATPRDIAWLVLRRAGWVAAAGLAGGLALAGAASRLMVSLLPGVPALDPAILLAVTASLAAVTGVASVAPALRASRVDPVLALRAE